MSIYVCRLKSLINS